MLSFLKTAFYKVSINMFSSGFICLDKNSLPLCSLQMKPPIPSTLVFAKHLLSVLHKTPSSSLPLTAVSSCQDREDGGMNIY